MQGPLSLKSKMLSTPLLSSKTSTPTRSRITSALSPLNSTPINQLKLSTLNQQTNKENFNSSNNNNPAERNRVKLNQTDTTTSDNYESNPSMLRQSRGFSKTITFGQCKIVGSLSSHMIERDMHFEQSDRPQQPPQDQTPAINKAQTRLNLSPILALNRKPTNTHHNAANEPEIENYSSNPINNTKQPTNARSSSSYCSFRSLTPNYKDSRVPDENYQQKSSREQQQLKESGSNTSLRSSSSFSSLFDKRSKTPTRLGSMAFGSISRKNLTVNANPSPTTKQPFPNQPSTSNNNTSTPSIRKSKSPTSLSQLHTPLNQSNCHDHSLVSCSQTNPSNKSKLMCQNNHNKIARYRVKTGQQDDSFQQNISYAKETDNELYYCSKCAIDLVQKGFSVRELTQNNDRQLPQNISQHPLSLHTSPRQHQPLLRQSKSFTSNNNAMLSFKTSYNSQIFEKLRIAEKLKHQISQQLLNVQTKRSIITKKFVEENDEIDCYYNSLISYIEQQRAKDKENLNDLKLKVQAEAFNNRLTHQAETTEETLQTHLHYLQQVIKDRNIDPSTLQYFQDLQNEVSNFSSYRAKSIKPQIVQLMEDQQRRLLYYPCSIQDQFDSFVSYFDTHGRLQCKTYQETMISASRQKPLPKNNNALRFSFQKALENQTRKKSFIMMDTEIMNPLNEESQEEEQDENSFSHQHMMATADGHEQNVEQKPFRTLFADEDDILQDDQEDADARRNNDMYSPTFKSI